MDRREFLIAGAGAAAALTTVAANGATAQPPARPKSRVIVVGGGMGGASVAKYLRLWGDAIDVTLIERNAQYLSCIMSNLVLSGQRTMAEQSFGYEGLRDRYGVRTVFDEVIEIDPQAVTVKLASGTRLSADRIVLAPGIAFDDTPGLSDPARMPHAWQAGEQTRLLATQLAAMPDNGVVALTVPKVPYRCPPGPYERACLIADWLRAHKPRARLIVLDANPDIVTEKENFSRAFTELHGKIIEYRPGVTIESVDLSKMTLAFGDGSLHADVVNLIPPQRAPALVLEAGLATATGGRFAPVDVLSYASTIAPKVHIIGDASATTQPKAGHIANQEAKICADALSRLLAGKEPDPAPVTHSACYSTITRSEASWLAAVFQYDPKTRAMTAVVDSLAASDGWSKKNFRQMNEWFDALMADTFS